MRVRVTTEKGGYYGVSRRKEGEVFEISDRKKTKKQEYPDAFSTVWMEPVEDDTLPFQKVEGKSPPPKGEPEKDNPKEDGDGDATGDKDVI